MEEARVLAQASLNLIMNLTTKPITVAILFQSLLLPLDPRRPAPTRCIGVATARPRVVAALGTPTVRAWDLSRRPLQHMWTNANSDNAIFEAAAGIVTNSTASPITLNGTLTDNSGYTFTNSTITLGVSPSNSGILLSRQARP